MSSHHPREAGLVAHRRLGRYAVHERLAHGGMGEVWRASVDGPGGFRKQVVLKTVRADLAARRSLVDMLIREAALAARLSHPNIVTVFDLDCVDGVYFFAMEYVPGHTLAELLRQAEERGAALPPWFVAAVLAACCDGLQYAHDLTDERGQALGLVHRDISLNNVMISATGNVTLLDFGIATATATGIGTREGRDLLMGKFQYMPPEVVRGLPSDRRCDIYGLGVVALIAMSGAMPYRARDDADLLQQIVAGPPRDLNRRCGRLPPDLARIVTRAMAHDAERRYPEASMLGGDLREYMHKSGSPPTTADDIARFVIDLFTPETAPIELACGTDSGPSIVIDIEESEVAGPPLPQPMPQASPLPAPLPRLTTLPPLPLVPPPPRQPPRPTPTVTAAASIPIPVPVPAPAPIAGFSAIPDPIADADPADVFTTSRPRPPLPANDGIDPFTSARPVRAGAGVFDGWSTRAESSNDDAPPPSRWPWSR